MIILLFFFVSLAHFKSEIGLVPSCIRFFSSSSSFGRWTNVRLWVCVRVNVCLIRNISFAVSGTWREWNETIGMWTLNWIPSSFIESTEIKCYELRWTNGTNTNPATSRRNEELNGRERVDGVWHFDRTCLCVCGACACVRIISHWRIRAPSIVWRWNEKQKLLALCSIYWR